MKNIFITGYPGFLASDLLSQLVIDHKEGINHIYLLVLETQKKSADEKLTIFLRENKLPDEICTLIVGDITKSDLGLQDSYHDITHVFHLAAIYDLAVPKATAERVNVHGTNCVNEWVKTLPNLEHYIYFSTAYVSGKREGRIYENELVCGQDFRNHYEQTKYEAELLVEHLKQTVPTTIIRPGIVKGHSQTGRTIKFDGLYFLLNFYDALQHLPVIPYLQAHHTSSPEGNFIPNDYLIKATSYLSMAEVSIGKTYHLTDPNPYSMKALQKMIAEHYLGRTPKGVLDVSIASWFLKGSFPLRKWLRVESEAMDYFIYHSSYDASQTQNDLKGTGIVCPDLADTLQAMVAFYRKYKHDQQKHIAIR